MQSPFPVPIRFVLPLVLLVAGLVLTPPLAAKKGEDEVDYLALATLLTRDGEYARAEEALAQVDVADEALDRGQYHTVRGLIALERSRHSEAADAFAEAIAAGQNDPLIHLYRAQAYFAIERYGDALAALDAAGEGVAALSGAWLMRGHAYWMLGRRQETFDTLSRASERFPGNHGFLRRQVFYLIDAGLNREAAELGRTYLRRAEGKAEDYVAIGTALRRSGDTQAALVFLEEAGMRFPEDVSIPKALAQTWLEADAPMAAAEILARAAVAEPALYAETAELLRRAGQPTRALRANALVPEPERRLKQRVGLLLELRRYDQVAAMEEALYRAGLLADEDVRYALAYAHYRDGDHQAAERHLQALTRPELFRKATELRRLMSECGDARWTCS
ncbi:MAG TPA: hypothetical protein DDZ76_00865 [Xanthomonadales bacterium]|nr:hypothetical protein [Xanthomonadales bacterium]